MLRCKRVCVAIHSCVVPRNTKKSSWVVKLVKSKFGTESRQLALFTQELSQLESTRGACLLDRGSRLPHRDWYQHFRRPRRVKSPEANQAAAPSPGTGWQKGRRGRQQREKMPAPVCLSLPSLNMDKIITQDSKVTKRTWRETTAISINQHKQ